MEDKEVDSLLDSDLSNSGGLDDFSGGFDSLGGYAGESAGSKYSDLLKELTNFDPIIQRKIRNWLGLEWDDVKKSYIKKNSAIINKKGAEWAIGFLMTYQSKTNFITNVGRDEFRDLRLDIIKVVWLVFPTNDSFAVKKTADWYRLCTELEHSAFLVIAGAGDGKYTKFFGESVSRHENVSLNNQPQMQQQQNQQGPPQRNAGETIKKFLGIG